MSIGDILIILGCLAGGYWIVNSVMGPGVDITRSKPPPGESAGDAKRDSASDPISAPSWAKPAAPKRLPTSRSVNWHLLLDVPATASRADIEAAFKRQQNKALASRDTHLQEQLRLAREAALAQVSKPG